MLTIIIYILYNLNLKKYCDKATDDYETVIITRKNDKNVVLMNQKEYNNLMENLYIMSNKKYYNELLKKRRSRGGKCTNT